MTPTRKNLMGLAASRYKRALGMKDNPGEGCYWKAVGCVSLAGAARVFFVTVALASPVGMAATARGAELAASVVVEAAGVRRYSFPPPAEMTRADVYTWSPTVNPRAVLVLCPGFNGDGEDLIRQTTWQEFARTNQVALCAIYFTSPDEDIQAQRGYYLAAHGSGDVLLQGIRLGFGRDLPILAYGFSGGAHFTASLVNWKPERVLGWCAYSAGWWEQPATHPAAIPPGIVACGDADARYGASLTFFAQGRALGRPWTWVSLENTEHARSVPLDQFVRAYFTALLHGGVTRRGQQTAAVPLTSGWRDVDTKEAISASQAAIQPTLACWLPDPLLATLWSRLHHP